MRCSRPVLVLPPVEGVLDLRQADEGPRLVSLAKGPQTVRNGPQLRQADERRQVLGAEVDWYRIPDSNR